MASVSFAKILPLVSQMGQYMKAGVDYYAALKAEDKDSSPEIVAAFVEMKMQDWDPKLAGKHLLDSETRTAGARFLAGLAVNFVGDK